MRRERVCDRIYWFYRRFARPPDNRHRNKFKPKIAAKLCKIITGTKTLRSKTGPFDTGAGAYRLKADIPTPTTVVIDRFKIYRPDSPTNQTSIPRSPFPKCLLTTRKHHKAPPTILPTFLISPPQRRPGVAARSLHQHTVLTAACHHPQPILSPM